MEVLIWMAFGAAVALLAREVKMPHKSQSRRSCCCGRDLLVIAEQLYLLTQEVAGIRKLLESQEPTDRRAISWKIGTPEGE